MKDGQGEYYHKQTDTNYRGTLSAFKCFFLFF
jgi:hypothetical protein